MNEITDKKNSDTKPGIVIGLGLLFFGFMILFYPSMLKSSAESARITIRQRAWAIKRAHPEREIKLSDCATERDLDDIRGAKNADMKWSMCFLLSFFLFFPLGLICIAWSAAGCSDLTVGEIAVSGAAGYLGYKAVKKIIK